MLKKKLLCLALTGVLALSFGLLAACGDKEDGGKDDGAVVLPYSDAGRTTTVAVHDPSVFQDPVSKTYYAFGSHFAVASSDDLIHWEQKVGDGSNEANGQREAQKLYGQGVNWRTVLSQAVAHAGAGMPSTWAPDVNYHDGKYYMYVSLTSGFGKNRSIIVRVESENVLGPYANETVIFKSDGVPGGPNAIDPELFTDKDGGLWMVYGSHFAGIYVLELENDGANWGMPKADQGSGTLLWKGGSKVVEGPFVFYNEQTEYYYLMTTYGALDSDYNMRIARSKNPDGPYVDIEETDVATVAGGTTHGNSVAGNYKFARQGSDGKGYAALGHNSVVKDADGRYFVVCHVRRQNVNGTVEGGHSLHVFQLFFNEDGWPVMSPNAYVGEKLGKVKAGQVASEYEVVIHSSSTSVTSVPSVNYTLESGGAVTIDGEDVGTWQLKGDYYITIALGEETYKGVVAPGWDMYMADQSTADGLLTITAVSATGKSLWALATY